MKCSSEFPFLKRKVHGKPLIYFDSAATTQKPKSVLEALNRFYTEEYATVHRAIYTAAQAATKKYNQAREIVRAFLNAKTADEIVFTSGTTEAINLVARRFPLKPGDEVIITETEHHSNIVPWQMACIERGIVLKILPVTDSGEIDLSVFEQTLSERTRLVSIAHIANATGVHHPIEKIIQLAHKRGAKVFVDGAQSAGHVPVDVQTLDCDFFAFSGHKVFGPTGIGVLYGKRELLEQMPPLFGGGDMIEKVTLEQTTYQAPPLRFEAGTPKIAEVIGLGAALEYIEKLGREKIATWEQKLVKAAMKVLEGTGGVRIIGAGAKRGAMISFVIEGMHPLDVGTLLDLEGIAVRTGHLCAQPTLKRFGVEALVRVSFAPYNTLEEVERFGAALEKVCFALR